MFHETELYGLLWQHRWLLAVAILSGLAVGGLVILIKLARRRLRRKPLSERLPSVSLPNVSVGLSNVREGVETRLAESRFAPDASLPSGDGGDGDDGGFSPNWRALGVGLGILVAIGLPIGIFYLQGAWPFGPWRGYTILGLPAYWTLFFVMLLVSLSILPLYVYIVAPLVPLLGGAMPRLTWIIAAWCQGATIFDRGADGRYHARPLRKNQETGKAEMWVDGDWEPVPGSIEFVSRLAWRPIAFTWEKTDESVREIRATEMGQHPVEYLVEKGMLDRETAEQYQPGVEPEQPVQAAADGGVVYNEWGEPVDVQPNGRGGDQPYNVLDYQGHAYWAFNPWPDEGAEDEYIIDTQKVKHKLAGAAEINLIGRAKDTALTDTARTTRVGQVVGWFLIFMALFGGVAVAYFTV